MQQRWIDDYKPDRRNSNKVLAIGGVSIGDKALFWVHSPPLARANGSQSRHPAPWGAGGFILQVFASISTENQPA